MRNRWHEELCELYVEQMRNRQGSEFELKGLVEMTLLYQIKLDQIIDKIIFVDAAKIF